ncbi:MAG: hydroxyisourate hydrolase [Congregibacter sp.]
MTSLSTHVLDTAIGRPASGIGITLSILREDTWIELAQAVTNNDGRLDQGFGNAAGAFESACYRLRFDTGDYLRAQGHTPFYPYAEVVFNLDSDEHHYHIPLLLSPFGYSTYRGS